MLINESCWNDLTQVQTNQPTHKPNQKLGQTLLDSVATWSVSVLIELWKGASAAFPLGDRSISARKECKHNTYATLRATKAGANLFNTGFCSHYSKSESLSESERHSRKHRLRTYTFPPLSFFWPCFYCLLLKEYLFIWQFWCIIVK